MTSAQTLPTTVSFITGGMEALDLQRLFKPGTSDDVLIFLVLQIHPKLLFPAVLNPRAVCQGVISTWE